MSKNRIIILIVGAVVVLALAAGLIVLVVLSGNKTTDTNVTETPILDATPEPEGTDIAVEPIHDSEPVQTPEATVATETPVEPSETDAPLMTAPPYEGNEDVGAGEDSDTGDGANLG